MATTVLDNYFASGMKTSDIAKATNKSINTIRHYKKKWKKVNNVVEHFGNSSLDINEEYKKLLADVGRLQKLKVDPFTMASKIGVSQDLIFKAIYTKLLMKDLIKIGCSSLTAFAIGKSLTLVEKDYCVKSDSDLKAFYDALYFGKIKAPKYFGPSCEKWTRIYIYGENGKPDEIKEDTADEKDSKLVTVKDDTNEALPTLEEVTRSEMEKLMADVYIKKVKTVVKTVSKETGVSEDTVFRIMAAYKKHFGGWI